MVAGTWERAAEGVPQSRWRRFISKAYADQGGRAFLWAPVALSFGIWAYFDLPREPGWLALAPLAVVAAVLLWTSRWRPMLSIIAFAMLGCVLAKAKADLAATPVIRATTAERIVTGTVEDVSATARGRRIIVVAPDNIEGFASNERPRRLRLTASAKQGEAALGSRIASKALLAPLPGPARPGGFDYGRDLWLDGIGGTGRVTGMIATLSTEVPWRLRPAAFIEALRQAIGVRIRETLTGTTAAIAEALITGERTSIPRPVTMSFQVSGLAHVLSISGLHMALAAGGVFWFVRAVLAPFRRWHSAGRSRNGRPVWRWWPGSSTCCWRAPALPPSAPTS
ncbi:MAG: ComEC/Rec2 family competence protein [Rhizobiales bacterium]|nr:ComEC/Rec2 family competence protein [Hyphomicrobiales bacterium]MBI3674575.1 ComEC/Rec2 family competence protein [Hyphomicrobiales bacterium]